MRLYTLLIALILTFSCKQDIIPRRFAGKWIIYEFYQKESDLFKKERSSLSLVNNTLSIDRRGKFLMKLNDFNDLRIFGDIFINQDKENVLTIENSSDDKLNGNYVYEMKVVTSNNKKSTYLKMESEKVIIEAYQYDFQIMGNVPK